MKIVKIIIGFVIVYALAVMAIGSYLSPDDLKKCGDAPSKEAGCHKADAIVAVSGGDTKARTDEAIKLYKNGWANFLVFSGAAADKSGPSNAEVMRDFALEQGVSSNAIIIEEESKNTTENASETQGVFSKYGIKDAIIVTSGYHERRAMLEFGRWAAHTELRAHPVESDSQWGPWWWLTPHGWYYAVTELVKSAVSAAGGINR